jgi:hypothetical protein
MMQGDQFRLPIELSYESDGSPVTEEQVKDVEICVGRVRKTMADGVSFNSENNQFYVYLNQSDTFTLRDEVAVQARVLFKNGDVIGIKLGSVLFNRSASREVLE